MPAPHIRLGTKNGIGGTGPVSAQANRPPPPPCQKATSLGLGPRTPGAPSSPACTRSTRRCQGSAASLGAQVSGPGWWSNAGRANGRSTPTVTGLQGLVSIQPGQCLWCLGGPQSIPASVPRWGPEEKAAPGRRALRGPGREPLLSPPCCMTRAGTETLRAVALPPPPPAPRCPVCRATSGPPGGSGQERAKAGRALASEPEPGTCAMGPG